MTKAAAAKTGDLLYDGLRQVSMHVPKTAWAVGAVPNLGGFVAPCDLTLVQIDYAVTATATSANAKLDLGVEGALTRLLNGFSFNGVTGSGQISMTDVLMLTRTVLKGEYVQFNLEAATAVGSLALTAYWVPTSSANV